MSDSKIQSEPGWDSSRPVAEPSQALQQSRPPSHAHVAAVTCSIFLIWLLFGIYGFVPSVRSGVVDFRNMYAAGYMVRTGQGHEIYDYAAQKSIQDRLVSKKELPLPFIRPAYQALFYAPFSCLRFTYAYYLFLALNLGVLAVCVRLLRPYMANLTRISVYLPGVLLLFLPLTVALMQGQDTIILLALLAGAFTCLQQDREYEAGVLVALGMFKFQMVIPIFLLFVAWRRWRFSAAFVGTSAVLAAISIGVAGWKQSLIYVKLLTGLGASLGFAEGPPLKMSLMANLHGAIYSALRGSPVALPLTLAASAATMIAIALRRPTLQNSLLIAIPTAVLVSYYMYLHDMSILFVPMVVVLDRLAGSEAMKIPHRRLQIGITATLFVVTTSMLVFNLVWLAALPLLAFTFMMTAWQTRRTGTDSPREPSYEPE